MKETRAVKKKQKTDNIQAQKYSQILKKCAQLDQGTNVNYWWKTVEQVEETPENWNWKISLSFQKEKKLKWGENETKSQKSVLDWPI